MCSLTVDEHVHPDGSGRFEVHSASGNSYTVDLREDTCDCPDFVQHEPDGDCYHIRRVRMALGLTDVPEVLMDRRDPCLVKSMEKFGAEPEPEPFSIEEQAARVVMADGGSVCPYGHPDCEGAQGGRERPVLCWDCWANWANN